MTDWKGQRLNSYLLISKQPALPSSWIVPQKTSKKQYKVILTESLVVFFLLIFLFNSANKLSYSIFLLQQQVAFAQGLFFDLPWGMLLHSNVPPTAGRPWRNGLNHAIKKQGQNTWNLLFSLLTPRAPLFSPCTCLPPPLSPLPPTSLLLHRTHCLWVHKSLHFTMPNSQLTTNPTTASIPPPPLAFITMTTHNKESKRERKRTEARKKGERVGGKVARWPLLLFIRREMTASAEAQLTKPKWSW